MKWLKGIAIGAMAFFGVRYLYNLKRAENKVAVQVGARVNKLTTQGVELYFDYNVKNPTASKMEMAIPLVKLYHGGSMIASSSLVPFIMPSTASEVSGRIPIGAYKETGTITSKILLPYLSMIGLGADLVKALKNRLNGGTSKVKMKVEVNTTIFTPFANIPYDDIQTIEI